MANSRWTPITDLPDNWPDMSSAGVTALSEIWQARADELRETEALKEFNARLCREWAIETGILENLYTINRGITVLLIEKGIEASLIPHGAANKPAEEIVDILRDHQEALDGIFEFVSSRLELSTSYIKQLHQVLTRHQNTARGMNGLGRLSEVSLLKGDYKRLPNNPVRPDDLEPLHVYCPPEQVPGEMENLLRMHKEHIRQEVPPEIEAAWLHHRFTEIHPFQDGNGRVARVLASCIFMRYGWFPLVVTRDHRLSYIDSLEKADRGDLKPLVDLFVKIQQKWFVKALGISEMALTEQTQIKHIVQAVGERLRERQAVEQRSLENVFTISDRLQSTAEDELTVTANELGHVVHDINDNYHVSVESNNEDNKHWFKKMIVETAKKLEYFADTRTYSAWVRLRIQEDRNVDIVFSFHSLGVDFLGVSAVSAFIQYRDYNDDGQATLEGPHVICDDLFQFSYIEDSDQVEARFNPWLNRCILTGLEEWRKQL